MSLSLITPYDVQQAFSEYIQAQRKALKLSRQSLAEKSTVPAATIKHFETTGQISLRQFLLLWQCVDDLKRLKELCQPQKNMPQSIAEVLNEKL